MIIFTDIDFGAILAFITIAALMGNMFIRNF